MKYKFQEKGQALIMIALAGVVLLAFTALAIDGSSVFSTRRRAQNAADAAALSAALAKTRGKDWVGAGVNSSTTNKFNTDGTSVVTVLECTDAAARCVSIPTGNDKSQYVYVKITTKVSTKFTAVFGVSEIPITVEAVARSVPGYEDKVAYGNAVVALNEEDCKSFWAHGNGTMTTVGGGVFVNSSSDCGFTENGSITLNTPCVSIVGDTSSPPLAGCVNYNTPTLPPMVMPNPSCGSQIATQHGDALSAGKVTGSFPPSGVTRLDGGVYCVYGDFSMNGNDTLTGSNVVIVMETGDIKWNGNAYLDLSAPTEGALAGLLIYVPPSNHSTIEINGTNDQNLTGTILAPSSQINLLGTASTSALNCQFVGDKVEYGGNFEGTIQYDESKNYHAEYAPSIETNQ